MREVVTMVVVAVVSIAVKGRANQEINTTK